MTNLGRVLLAISLAAIGAFTLAMPGFRQAWSTVPHWIPLHDQTATAMAVILVVGGLALLVPRAVGPASLVLSIYLLLRLLLRNVPFVVAQPLVIGPYEDMAESMVELAGVWTVYAMLPREGIAHPGQVRAGQILYALALIPFGLAHLAYVQYTAGLIPAWLPFHVPLVYFTGAAYIAAGLAILSGMLARLAAMLTAIMVSLFTLIVWVPAVIAKPGTVGNWSEICVSIAIMGAAFVIADSLSDKPWGFARGA